MTEQQPKETTSVTNTLDDLLSNPFSSMDELTPTQQNELSELKEQQAAPRLIDKLPQERQAQAKELASKIDVQDSQAVITYGLNEANPNELRAGEGNFIQKMLGKVKQSVYEITAKYQKIGAQIDKIAVKLTHEKDGLLKDNAMLDQLYQKNKDYFDALNIYIAAGELKAEELRTQIIPEAMKKAEESGDQMV